MKWVYSVTFWSVFQNSATYLNTVMDISYPERFKVLSDVSVGSSIPIGQYVKIHSYVVSENSKYY